MREENYFEIKLENCKETLNMAQRKLEHLDIQIKNLELRFEHDKKGYNDQAIHMQAIVEDMNKRIPKLEKQLKKGFRAYNVRTGKGYSSYEAMHIAHLESLRQESIENQKAIEARNALKRELLKTPETAKLSPEDKQLKEAAIVQKEAQPKEDIKVAQEQQLEAIVKKREFYEAELAKLGKITKPEPFIIESQNNEIEKMKATRDQIQQVKEELNGKITKEEKDKLWVEQSTQGQALSKLYKQTEGGNAVWNGVITKGFRTFCEINQLKIGE